MNTFYFVSGLFQRAANKSFLRLLLTCLLFLIVDGTQAQVGPQSKSTRPRTTAITTQDEATPVKVRLKIEAGLVFRSGDVKPVARTTFYLLNAHPGDILRTAGLKTAFGDTTSSRLVVELIMASRAGASADPELQAFLKVALPALRLHTVGEVTTGFDGKGEFAPVKPGTYHIFSFSTAIGQSNVYWSVPVDLSSGETHSIVLDNNNADIW